MPGYCFAPGCNSGYSSTIRKNKLEGEKNPSLFICPKNAELLEKWRRAIPRKDKVFSSIDKLCELHFDDECIMRTFEIKHPDGSVSTIERERPSLKEGSIPSKFPNVPKYLSSNVRKRKAPAERTPLAAKEKKILTEVVDETSDQEQMDETSDQEQMLLYVNLIKQLENVEKPDPWWTISHTLDYVICAKWDTNYACERRVVVFKDFSTKKNSMDERRQSRGEVADGGPGYAYMMFVLMENLLDKLKLLNYDTEFTQEFKMKYINRHYFALPTNPGEQFFMFSSLAAWLIRKCGIKFDSPQEFDDPNGTIASILEQVRQMGVAVDFPPSKLKQGWGEQVIFVLSRLAEQALMKNSFNWKRPIILPEDDDSNDAAIDADESEVTLEKIEEEMITEAFEEDDSDEEGEILDLEALRNLSISKQENSEKNKPEEVMESNVDAMEWKLEVERVMHQLKVTVRNDSRDWRSHLDQIHQHRKNIDETLSTTKQQLDKLHSDISRSMEKISSREKYLNNQLEQLILEYRTAQDQLAQVREQYKSVSGGVTERSRTLSQITEELEQVKQEMDERGSNMTDGKPLVNIRKALSKLKVELSQMDVRIGVASHTLLQAKLKEKGNLQRAINNPPTLNSFTIF